ncbi:hypothetical protein [Aestuariivivens sediminis]|uniref:hypothetical protein n=1 Tax=Aestuariivivens sediminis TaxID=2913557 RepID=UPI001F5A3751|nr:hypothetical protein [Aestuariivivens sediminis]
MKTLISIIALIALFNCSSDEGGQFSLDVSFEFGIKDSEGNDLLNPENPNAFKESEIKLFYVINGNTEEVYDGNLDYPRHFLIYQYYDQYRIRVFLNHSETENIPVTYIQWNEMDTDTIKNEMNRSDTFVKIQKVWLNDNLIWDTVNKSEPYFELLK